MEPYSRGPSTTTFTPSIPTRGLSNGSSPLDCMLLRRRPASLTRSILVQRTDFSTLWRAALEKKSGGIGLPGASARVRWLQVDLFMCPVTMGLSSLSMPKQVRRDSKHTQEELFSLLPWLPVACCTCP